jgi:hypothetical protein
MCSTTLHGHEGKKIPLPVYLFIGAAGLYLWWIIYSHLMPAASFFSYKIFRLTRGLSGNYNFFIYDAQGPFADAGEVCHKDPDFTPEKTRDMLAGKRVSATCWPPLGW